MKAAQHFLEHGEVLTSVRETLLEKIEKGASLISDSLGNDGTVFWCGNGGSASDSQHLAAELIGRFKNNRYPLRSLALNSDSSVMTCISNDFGYDNLFSRQLEGLAKPSDLLVAISTSGSSNNICNVLKMATKLGVKSIALLGKSGGSALELCDFPIVIPSDSTARVQEMHILIGHIFCDLVEQNLNVSG